MKNKDLVIQFDSALLDFKIFLWLLEPVVGMVTSWAQVTWDLWVFSVWSGSIKWQKVWLC